MTRSSKLGSAKGCNCFCARQIEAYLEDVVSSQWFVETYARATEHATLESEEYFEQFEDLIARLKELIPEKERIHIRVHAPYIASKAQRDEIVGLGCSVL